MVRSFFSICLVLTVWSPEVSACAWSVLKGAYLSMATSASLNRNSPWECDGVSSGRYYSMQFRELLPGGIDKFLESRKADGKTAHVAEFFGSAVYVSRPELVDSATGVRLELYYEDGVPRSFRDDHEAPLPHPLWQEIAGSIYLRSTWNELAGNMKDRSIPAFDLIVVRPLGGLNPGTDTMNQLPQLAAVIVNRIYEKLSPDDGLMLVHLMAPMPGREEWTNALLEAGVDIKWKAETFAFRIIKTKNSPTSLPKL